jgi:translation initiation factor 2-alpha kinase 4
MIYEIAQFTQEFLSQFNQKKMSVYEEMILRQEEAEKKKQAESQNLVWMQSL